MCVCVNARDSTRTAERRRREATKDTKQIQPHHIDSTTTMRRPVSTLPSIPHINRATVCQTIPDLMQRTHTLQMAMLHLVMVKGALTPVRQRIHYHRCYPTAGLHTGTCLRLAHCFLSCTTTTSAPPCTPPRGPNRQPCAHLRVPICNVMQHTHAFTGSCLRIDKR